MLSAIYRPLLLRGFIRSFPCLIHWHRRLAWCQACRRTSTLFLYLATFVVPVRVNLWNLVWCALVQRAWNCNFMIMETPTLAGGSWRRNWGSGRKKGHKANCRKTLQKFN
ncbi:uncharacterized protein BDW70DRAFT_125436 [Aspergillus foveolatus]|uniref:uncharacterized protein n=1 Tax=Aspergillus foveolatus TaxID=210207 RepID=UPI003CCCA4E7